MSSSLHFIVLLSLAACLLPASSLAAEPTKELGFKALFDGKSLRGWSGDESFWRVEDGVVVAESTKANPCRSNTFLRWEHGLVDDFELRLKVRISGTDQANSGIQFRSQVEPDGHVVGYQADLARNARITGMLYDEKGRGILCPSGKTNVVDASTPRVEPSEATATPEAKAAFRKDDWNDYRILARGHRIRLFVNGVQTADLTDNNTEARDFQGVLALQLHSGPPMKVEFKDVQLKRFPLTDGRKKIVFLGGRPSHGWGQHEFNAASHLLAKATQRGLQNALVTVYTNGWPADATWLDNADCLVIGTDGEGRHPLVRHRDETQVAIDRGLGLICWHYAVEPTMDMSEQFRSWLGGNFEHHYSVNPHWTASFDTFPDHPITRGVEPFEVRDEWYYHMKFVPDEERISPILTTLPPRTTLNRPDDAHGNNPIVREAVLERKEPQHVAWAYERPDGSRAFGFTGGHFHNNWANDGFRTIVLNAIAWTAGLDVPDGGVPSLTPTTDELEQNIDPGQRNAPKKARQVSLNQATVSDKPPAMVAVRTTSGDHGSDSPAWERLMSRAGDPVMGRVVFHTNGTCAKCHRVGRLGGDVGPKLDGVGRTLNLAALFRSVFEPSAEITRGYESVKILTLDGQVLTGVKQQQTEDAVVLKTPDGQSVTIAVEEIEFIGPESVSAMPAGLEKLMTEQELVDVVAYMKTLQLASH